jgi:hypothetical protein
MDDIAAIKDTIARKQVSIFLNAGHLFMNNTSGVFDSTMCIKKLDHAIFVVCYFIDASTGFEYWTVKNSWGEAGCIRLAIID